MLPSYQATLSVPMTCDSCVRNVSAALDNLPGIRETSFSLSSKLVTITSTEPPSNIISAIESTGRSAILRGSGKANSAAVCILETLPATVPKQPEPSPVRGLARFIELSDHLTMLDITLTGLPPGIYHISIRTSGDISSVPASMGDVFSGLSGDMKGDVGQLRVDSHGKGSMVGELGWRVWEIVGRGIMVKRRDDNQGKGIIAGVIARSAGVWENQKVVCGCSGKTVWGERQEMVGKGML